MGRLNSSHAGFGPRRPAKPHAISPGNRHSTRQTNQCLTASVRVIECSQRPQLHNSLLIVHLCGHRAGGHTYSRNPLLALRQNDYLRQTLNLVHHPQPLIHIGGATGRPSAVRTVPACLGLTPVARWWCWNTLLPNHVTQVNRFASRCSSPQRRSPIGLKARYRRIRQACIGKENQHAWTAWLC